MRVESFLQQIRQDADLCLQQQNLAPQTQGSYEELKGALIVSLALRIVGAALVIFPLLQILKSVILLASTTAATVSVTAIVSLSLAAVSLILIRELIVIGINIANIHRLAIHALLTADSVRQLHGWSLLRHGWHTIRQAGSGSGHLVSELQGIPGELHGTWIAAPMYRAIRNLTASLNAY